MEEYVLLRRQRGGNPPQPPAKPQQNQNQSSDVSSTEQWMKEYLPLRRKAQQSQNQSLESDDNLPILVLAKKE